MKLRLMTFLRVGCRVVAKEEKLGRRDRRQETASLTERRPSACSTVDIRSTQSFKRRLHSTAEIHHPPQIWAWHDARTDCAFQAWRVVGRPPFHTTSGGASAPRTSLHLFHVGASSARLSHLSLQPDQLARQLPGSPCRLPGPMAVAQQRCVWPLANPVGSRRQLKQTPAERTSSSTLVAALPRRLRGSSKDGTSRAICSLVPLAPSRSQCSAEASTHQLPVGLALLQSAARSLPPTLPARARLSGVAEQRPLLLTSSSPSSPSSLHHEVP